jgi:hypothetical protein
VALLLSFILLPSGFVIGTVYNIIKGRGNEYIYNTLIEIDHLGNVVCAPLFNLILITPAAISVFGLPNETISSVLGKNKVANTLSWFGYGLAWLLNSLQENHVENSIKE